MTDKLDFLESLNDLHLNNECAKKLFKENSFKNDFTNRKLAKPLGIRQKKQGKSQQTKSVFPGLQSKIDDLQFENKNLRDQLEVIRNILDDTEGFCANIIKHHTNTKENTIFKRWQRDALCLSRKIFHALRMPMVLPRHEGGKDNDFGASIITNEENKTPVVNLKNCFRPGSAYNDPCDNGVAANTYESLKAILDEQDQLYEDLDKKPRRNRIRNKKNSGKKATDGESLGEKISDEETSNKDSSNIYDGPKGAYGLENYKQGVHGIGTNDKGAPGIGETGKGKPGMGETGKGKPGMVETGKGKPGMGETDKGKPGNGVSTDLGFLGDTPFIKAIFDNETFRRERRVKGGRPIIYKDNKDFPRDVCLSKSFKKKKKVTLSSSDCNKLGRTY